MSRIEEKVKRLTILCGAVTMACLCVSQADAAGVFMWVANGTSVTGYDNKGNAISGATANAPTGGDYFSLAVSGTAGSQNIFVADSVKHTLTEYKWNGTALTTVNPTNPFVFASDPSGGAISPQEIAVDGSGNLWTTSYDGQIVMYNATSGVATTMQPAGGSLAAARGMMIVGSEVYVTVGGYGSGGLEDFTTTANSSVSSIGAIGSATVGATPVATGQTRGVTEDSHGDIFICRFNLGRRGNRPRIHMRNSQRGHRNDHMYALYAVPQWPERSE
jgi:hypothetical protein